MTLKSRSPIAVVQRRDCFKKERNIYMNKGPIAKYLKFRGGNEYAPFRQKNSVVSRRTVRPLPPWSRGSTCKEKRRMKR